MAKKKKEAVCDTTQAVQMFKMFGAAFVLRYKTPSKIPERMKRALDYLVAEGTLTETKEPLAVGFALAYKVGNELKLKTYPPMSLAQMNRIENPLPVYSE